MLDTYNSIITAKLFDFIKLMYERVSDDDIKGYMTKIDKYEVIESDINDINLIMSAGSTYSMTMRVHYSLYDEHLDLIEHNTADLQVPKMINNLFIIEGKYRVPTNELNNDYEVVTYANNIIFSNDLKISYDKSKPGYRLVCVTHNERYEDVYNDFTDEYFAQNLELFKLSKKAKCKIKIKLNTDDVGDYLTQSIVQRLIDRGVDKLRDNIIDKRITTLDVSLMTMFGRAKTRHKILAELKKNYYRNHVLTLTPIQTRIFKFFRLASSKSIDIPTTINPMVFDSLRYKLVLPEFTAYTESMADVIDIVNTPINNNVNRLNEMNVCITVIDGEIFINCYKYPTMEKVQVYYLEYLTKKVLLNECWDYDKRELKEKDGKLYCKLRQNTFDVDKDYEFDYIEPRPDEKLSVSTRQIPMINMSDTIRLAMATSMEKQALGVQECEPRLVTSGHDSEDFNESTLIYRYSFGSTAKVTKITKSDIWLMRDDGSIIPYSIPRSISGMNNTEITFIPQVKVGDQVKDGDVLIQPKSLSNNTLHLGTNALTLYMDYLGLTHEDGIVISESYAHKMMHWSYIMLVQPIWSEDYVRYIRPIGSKVTSGDILVNRDTRTRIKQDMKDLFKNDGRNKGIFQTQDLEYSSSNLEVTNSIDEAYVVDVIFQNLDDINTYNNVDITKSTIDKYINDRVIKSDYDDLPPEVKSQQASETELPRNAIGAIIFKLAIKRIVRAGDKMCNTYGGKGIISAVLPDECMPRLVSGPEEETGQVAEVIINPPSVVSRKNPSQIYECVLTNCIEKIHEKAELDIKDKKFDELRKFLHNYYGEKYDDYTDEALVENHEKGVQGYRMVVGSFSTINRDTIVKWVEELGVSEKSYVFMPDVVMVNNRNDDKPRFYALDKYIKQDGDDAHTYYLGNTEQPILYGREYMLKLYHSAIYTGKVTNSQATQLQPVMHKGFYHDAGQKIGEMELWALLSVGTENFALEQSPNMLSNQYRLLNEMLIAGYTIADADGHIMMDDYQNSLSKLKDLYK